MPGPARRSGKSRPPIRRRWLSITGAPRIADGRIFIGEAGSEFEQRGYLAAYDADTGKELWRWWAVPGDPSKPFEQPELKWAAKTWSGEWWKAGGGGTPVGRHHLRSGDRATFIIGTGNGAPWPAEIRSPGGGDNLFTSSIVALDAKTGKYEWHYQETPDESFDFDSTAQITTADLVIDGKKRHVVMHAPKNGVFYVLDAKTGKVLVGEAVRADGQLDDAASTRTAGRSSIPQANYGKTGKGFYLVRIPVAQSGTRCPSIRRHGYWSTCRPTTAAYGYVAEAGAKMGNQLLSINVAKHPQGPPPKVEGAGNYLVAWDPVNRRQSGSSARATGEPAR